MSSIFAAMLTAWVIGFAFGAVVVLPFVAGREVKDIARLAASDLS